jgi:carbon-monoxide dehydrogenase small subunit
LVEAENQTGEAHMIVETSVNGKKVKADIPPSLLLSDFLRENLDLTGTHIGCDTSQCGACVVHVDGVSIKSCTLLAAAADGKSVTTIEGLAGTAGADLHPMQEAFHLNHGLQCGFCTPGMIMSAVDFAQTTPNPTESDVRHWLEGNICRCTGYQNIVAAVLAGASAMQTRAGG